MQRFAGLLRGLTIFLTGRGLTLATTVGTVGDSHLPNRSANVAGP